MSTYLSTDTSTPLTDPLRVFIDACNKNKPLMVGVEFEILCVKDGTFDAAPYFSSDGIESVLKKFQEKSGWEALYENGHIIALMNDGSALTLEPGAQIELSSSPRVYLKDLNEEYSSFLKLLLPVMKEKNINALGLGIQPVTNSDDMKIVPKIRYRIMDDYLPARGRLARDMMRLTAGIQCNFDYRSEEEANRLYQTGVRSSPVITAISANSPFYHGKSSNYHSYRTAVWLETDPDRCGVLTDWMDKEFTFSAYVDYAMQVPVFFIVRDDKWIPMNGKRFIDFYRDGFEGYNASEEDWILHLTTIFTEIRFKQVFEVRGMDGLPPGFSMAMPAIWKGILYDEEASGEVCKLLDFKKGELLQFHLDVSRVSLDAVWRKYTALELAKELISIAEEGLRRQNSLDTSGGDERKYIELVKERIIAGGSSLAKTGIDSQRAEKHSRDNLFTGYLY